MRAQFDWCKWNHFLLCLNCLIFCFSFNGLAQKPELVVQTGQSGGATVVFSSDNKLIASSDGTTIKIWDLKTSKELRAFEMTDFGATDFDFSPDNKFLAVCGAHSGGDVSVIALFDLARNRQLWSKDIEGGCEAEFSSDGKFIDGSDENFDAKTGNSIKLPELPEKVFSLDDMVFAMKSGKTLNVFNSVTKRLIIAIPEKVADVHSFSLNSDGSFLATSNSTSVNIWDVKKGQQIKSLSIKSLLLNAKKVVDDNFPGEVKFVDIEREKWLLNDFIETIEKNENATYKDSYNDVNLSPDGQIIELTINTWTTGGQVSYQQKQTYFYNISDGSLIDPIEKKLYGNCYFIDFSMFTHTRDWKMFAGNLCAEENNEDPSDELADEDSSKEHQYDGSILIFDREIKKEVALLKGHSIPIDSVSFLSDNKIITRDENNLRVWGEQVLDYDSSALAVSPDEKIVAFSSETDSEDLKGEWEKLKERSDSKNKPDIISLRDAETGKLVHALIGHTGQVNSAAFSSDGMTLASASDDGTVKIWEVNTGSLIQSYSIGEPVYSIRYIPNSNSLIFDNGIIDTKNKSVVKESFGDFYETFLNTISDTYEVRFIGNTFDFTPDGKFSSYLSGQCFGTGGGSPIGVSLDDVKTQKSIGFDWNLFNGYSSVALSPNGNLLAMGHGGCYESESSIDLVNIKTLKKVSTLNGHKSSVISMRFSPNGKYLLSGSLDTTAKLWDISNGKLLATLYSLGKDDWAVATPDGRFDTNKPLDNIEGLHWLLPDQPFTPKPLEIFMRQYYEPGLLQRVLKCTEDKNCNQVFKPLPLITQINRVQPRVEIKEIKPQANDSELVDVIVEAENQTEENARKIKTKSGVYDLRLFRDGQLVGTSASAEMLEDYIKNAPQLIKKDKIAKTLINTQEVKAWREANDLSKVVKFDGNKAIYTFKNIRLPKDGRKEIEFSAYAFNADRVKSETARRVFQIEKPETRDGNVYLISIGVNASQNPAYNLGYAANDARETQKILGEKFAARLKGTNSKLIQTSLVSDYSADGKTLTENTARKNIVKGVFALLAGKAEKESSETLKDVSLTVDGKRFAPDQLPPVEPEDSLIIAYSGHGYASQNGIFYLLPYDIGETTRALTPEVLPNLISSDELSLWMQDVTAKDMLMIIDACHSAAAVQGDGFKPGPMGSRGLGQLAYDKGMKILSATQADNVALELGALRQGLLSYALLQDGINKKEADIDDPKDNKLFMREWLRFGERRVPALYREIQNGTFKNVTVGGKSPDAKQRAEIVCADKKCRQNVQQPKLFDFNQRRADSLLISFLN